MAALDKSRNQDLAGKSVKQGGYTVTYDDRGYFTRAVKDGGKSATNVVETTHANDSAAHQEAYQAAQRGDWDAVGTAVNKIGMAGGVNADGTFDMGAANKYYGELVNQFGYNARDYYGKKYDQVYGKGSSDVFDATNGAIKTIDQWNQLTGGASVPTQSGGFGTTGGSYGVTGSGYDYTPNGDAYQYIQDMYAANSASQLAALKAAYEQNVMDYNAQDDLISKQAQQLRNQAASQNDLQRMYMNEMGIMQGLNTGTTGQMALAQSAALQGNLASIGTQEQQALSDSALERSKLKVQYSAAVDQAIAQNNYELANALLDAYYREVDAAQQAAAAEQEQANWQAKFDYQKQQDAWTNAAEQAELLAGFGDFSGYKALGYSDAKIAMMQNAWNAQYGTPAVGTAGTPIANPGYNNGGLTSDQVKVLQNYYGVTADGAWGKNSTSAAGGMTAAQAWERFTAPVTDVSQLSANGIAVANSLARGYTTGTQQRDAIISAYQNGRITRGEAEFLARAVGASL